MRDVKTTICVAVVCVMAGADAASADTFGTGANQFTIYFVPISGSTNPGSGYGIVNNDYRIGKFEVINDNWNKFKNAYGTVAGSPTSAYDGDTYWTGTNVPTNMVSWYEAAQFVNWLNTSTGHQAAYKFTGAQGTGNYTFAVWDVTDAGYDANNPYRNSNAFYFLPTEDEWVKAAYWNGVTLQTYATVGDTVPVAGVDTNFDNAVGEPWDVGSGSEELSGTYDTMGNVWEWLESPADEGNYLPDADRGGHGGWYGGISLNYLKSWYRYIGQPDDETTLLGFRVASVVCPSADLTGDCFVNLADLAKLASQWLTGRQ